MQINFFRRDGVTQSEHDELALQVLKQFRVIYGSAKQQFRDIEETCGVSGSQLWLMHKIAATPGIGVSELANETSIHQSTCSQLLNKLQKRGLVVKVRGMEDQRRVGLELSPEAHELLKKAPGPAEGVLQSALKHLNSKELDTLAGHLSGLISQLRIRNEHYANKHLSDI